MRIDVRLVDYKNTQDTDLLVQLLNAYAQDPMGGATPLSDTVLASLGKDLSEVPNAFSLIAYVDDKPAGLTNCFQAFSTFKSKPLINIHDVTVLPEFRGRGVSLHMLKRVEEIARERGCCKVTLEVLSGNQIAKNAYTKLGFENYELDPDAGIAEFWQRVIPDVK